MASRKDNTEITLESLLKLKKHERPGGDFWDSFDNDFQRRRLNALVEKPTIRDLLWDSGMKALAFGLPALLLVGLSIAWMTDGPVIDENLTASYVAPVLDTGSPVAEAQPAPVLDDVIPQIRTSMASSQFVVDAIQESPSSGMNFRKVLYTPAIRLSAPSGAFYVRDSMSSSNYRVTTADAKLGRNF